jgi:hypothetical protein
MNWHTFCESTENRLQILQRAIKGERYETESKRGNYPGTAGASVVIGLIAGILVVLSVEFFDKVLHIDDPVGAISVHGICGVWGT